MRLRYELSDPYAVRVAFTVDESDEAVEWITGRDLQIDGLKGRVGEGDVRIWPAGEHDRGAVYIVLKPPSAMALLEVPAQDIKRFLQETETLVPRGSESEHIAHRLGRASEVRPRRRLRSSCPESGSARDCSRACRCRPRPPWPAACGPWRRLAWPS
ncbi:SsgA family sporulation/cell division regulator [Streptomyces sp. NBC_01728]|uniref:SsgA family sporulation/cell division regulator n=1 Tax=unclassified Streptomyces TaxID=2593676 RepID=UPI00224C7DB3|nr:MULTISPECIES: SsgA family sporulation/cell division regulator [unclassified Streptomyces]MCX4459216.1 SsgA family sporulation/cell division regulator [Streptomyces sp. NBC_01719]MCX4498573.1 SsgA family sporulation/cell division regulator [Streptomyces sp. NBC_01728]